MKIKELLEKGLINNVHWLLKATVQDEDVDVFWGTVVWHNGIWHDGRWEDGRWEDGIWHGGIWKGGTWYDGDWVKGIWYDGIWEDGIWEDGIWYDGIWKGGTWHGGIWKGGAWLGGATAIKSKYAPLLLSNGKIRIGCKTKTIEEWDVWFNSIEEYDTPRGSKEFKMTQGHYLAIKAYALVMQHGPTSINISVNKD